MRPLIGITAGETYNLQYPNAPKVMGQMYTYVEAIERAGGVPVILPIVSGKQVLRRLYDICDGILLAGGNDLDPALYNAEPKPRTVQVHKERDAQEMQLVQWAEADDKPTLGVCRGMQLMNVAAGGTLWQDIATDLPQAGTHFISTDKMPDPDSQIIHQLRIDPGSQLAESLGVTRLGTNAYHHQAVKTLGKDLRATAWAEDDVIEALELRGKKFMVGVQSHPESLEAEIEPGWQKLFQAFVDSARPS